MFIDLKNGSCINASEVFGATFGKQSGSYIVNITMKPSPRQTQSNINGTSRSASIDVKFSDARQANEYIKKYFNIEDCFD